MAQQFYGLCWAQYWAIIRVNDLFHAHRQIQHVFLPWKKAPYDLSRSAYTFLYIFCTVKEKHDPQTTACITLRSTFALLALFLQLNNRFFSSLAEQGGLLRSSLCRRLSHMVPPQGVEIGLHLLHSYFQLQCLHSTLEVLALYYVLHSLSQSWAASIWKGDNILVNPWDTNFGYSYEQLCDRNTSTGHHHNLYIVQTQITIINLLTLSIKNLSDHKIHRALQGSGSKGIHEKLWREAILIKYITKTPQHWAEAFCIGLILISVFSGGPCRKVAASKQCNRSRNKKIRSVCISFFSVLPFDLNGSFHLLHVQSER